MEDEKHEIETGADEAAGGGREILCGVVIYAVLALCATVSLVPLLFSEGIPFPSIPEGGFKSRIWGESSLLKSSAVVVSFFAFDEEESRRQLAELTTLRIRYPDEKIAIIAACTAFKHPEAVAAFAERVKAPFPIIPCPNEMAAHIVGGGTLPVTILRDGKGNVIRVFRELATSEEIADSIRAFLGELKKRPVPLRTETTL